VKILHTVEYYAPSRGGAQEVVRRISELLAARGHSVTVATTRLDEREESELNGVSIASFDVHGNAVSGLQGEVERYRRWLLDGDFDVMLNYAAQQWATDSVFPLLDELECAKLLAPCGFSMLHSPAWADYFAKLPGVLRGYDRLVFHGERYRDFDFAREHDVGGLEVVPNGASQSEFEAPAEDFRARHGIPRDVPLLLTVGTHTGLKGHAAAIEAFRRARIGPAVLVVIGNSTGEGGCLADCRRRVRRTRWLSLGRKRVLLLDPPRGQVVAAYRAADVFLFPSEVECSPVVLFEALASRTPFVSTACGNAEEIAAWSGSGAIAPAQVRRHGRLRADPRELARIVEQLVRDPERRRIMAEAGHAAWLQEFTWERIALRYEALYTELVGGVA